MEHQPGNPGCTIHEQVTRKLRQTTILEFLFGSTFNNAENKEGGVGFLLNKLTWENISSAEIP